MGAYAHGRAPGSGTAGGIDLERAECVQSVGELAEDAAGEPGEGDELTAVGVAGELETDAGLLDDGQAMGCVVEQDAGLGGVGAQDIKRGTKPDGVVGVGIRDAENLHAVDGYLFIFEDVDACV